MNTEEAKRIRINRELNKQLRERYRDIEPQAQPEEAEHHRLLRTNPLYRMWLRMQDLENENMPPITPFEEKPPEPQVPIVKNIKWGEIQQLQGRITHLENKVMEMRSVKKKQSQACY